MTLLSMLLSGLVARTGGQQQSHGSGVRPSGLANLCDLPGGTLWLGALHRYLVLSRN